MAIRPIIIAPDPVLKAKAKPVENIDGGIVRLMDDMLETMYRAPGIGLAAPQIGILQRVIVVDVADKDEKPQPFAMANPEILWKSDETSVHNEGCLSLRHWCRGVHRQPSGGSISPRRLAGERHDPLRFGRRYGLPRRSP